MRRLRGLWRGALVVLTASVALAVIVPLAVGAEGEDPPAGEGSAPTPTATATATAAPSTETPVPTTPTATPFAPRPQDEHLLVLLDKQTALPEGWEPADLVTIDAGWIVPGFAGLQLTTEAAGPLTSMLTGAMRAGYDVRVRSAYRSYHVQVDTFAYWVAQLGETEARRVSAEPGHSEHQLGTTVDLATRDVGWDLTTDLGDTEAGRWLLRNAWRYGFALSYPAGKEAETGYSYEPWHFRYIGRSAARAWAESGQTLRAFLRDLDVGPGVLATSTSTAGY